MTRVTPQQISIAQQRARYMQAEADKAKEELRRLTEQFETQNKRLTCQTA